MDEKINDQKGASLEKVSAETKTTIDTDSVNHVVEKRSRLISASIIAIIIISVISVSVFGIFQLTSKLLVVCPFEVPINDPAPVLWQDIISEQTKSAKLGVPEKMADVYLKGVSLAENKSK